MAGNEAGLTNTRPELPAPHSVRLGPRISVIVAVYNPGQHFDDLIDSFLRQTLPPDQFEVLLCDDGSDEATQGRLAAVSAAHPHLKVIELEHSGWPGTPRNAGIDAAAGKYVFFCDHDDRMGDEALQRLADYADENHSDVVVGKLVGVGRALPRNMFRANVPNAVLGTDPLLEILTPHKLFRTEFIRENGIRFPDGKVRLEDHMFVMRSYFAAQKVSILADYPCYYWTKRQDRPSASATVIEPEYYYRHLETVLDIVEENEPPGPDRDAMLQHWYRGKILKRLAGRLMLRYSDEYRTDLLNVVGPLVAKRFPASVDQYLAFPMRVRSALLRADQAPALLALAQVEAGLKASARVTSITWDEARCLRIEVEAEVRFEDGSELAFVPDHTGGWVWRPPTALTEAGTVLTDDVLQVGSDLAGSRIEVFVRARHDGADYVQPVVEPQPQTEPGVLRTTVVIDPRSARAGRPVTRFSDLVVQVTYVGWNFGTALRISAEALAAAELSEQVIGRRAFTLGTRGTDRLFVQARRLPVVAKPVSPAVAAVAAPIRRRVIRKVRRVIAAARTRLRRGESR
jgi:glycosyltransferase involved in cell wall biosynthesis